MREFFHGWRRKAGVVTLVMAMLLFGVWMRSYSVWDSIPIKDGISLHFIQSIHGGVCWTRHVPSPSNSQMYSSQNIPIRWTAQDADKSHLHRYWLQLDVEWQRNWCRFHFAATTIGNPNDKTRHDTWIIPYWSLVAPPTLLSAYLILWKPRSKPKNTAAELPQDGA